MAKQSRPQKKLSRVSPTVADEYSRTLEAKKSESALQLLFKTSRLTNEWALERLARKHSEAAGATSAPGHREVPSLRESHTRLLPHIELEGTRITTLATRLGISKQAVSELVGEMEVMGGLERTPDPQDGRAKLVCFTPEGRQWIIDGLEHLRDLEAELSQALGPQKLHKFRKTCAEMLEFLETQSAGC